MRRAILGSALFALAIALAACSAAPFAAPAAHAPTATPSQPCVDNPELVAAADVIWSAKANPSAASVYGQAGGRSNNLLVLLNRGNLAAISNPKGAGVVVSVVMGGGKAFARDTANRTGWLVLDGLIYPIDVDAAQAFGLLWDGYPSDVQERAGLGQDYFDFDSYGISDFVSYNADTIAEFSSFMVEANGLCERPTGLGQ